MRMRRSCWVFFRRSGTVRIHGQATQPDQAWQLLWKVKEQWQMEVNVFVRLWQMMVLIWFLRQLIMWESSCQWCQSHFFLGLPTRFLISSLLIWCLKAWIFGNGAERSLRLESLPTLAKHTKMCMSMMRWPDTANGAWVTLVAKVQGQLQRIGTLFSVHAKLWRTLEWLESQRVASQGLWCRDSWVTKIVFNQHPWQGTLWAGCSLDGEQRVGTIGTLRICLEELWQCQQVAKDWIGYSSIHTAQMAIDSCNGVHLKRACENLPLVVRWIDLVPRWWSPASPLFARCNAAFAGDGETLQRYVFHLLHLWLHYLMQLLLEMTKPVNETFLISLSFSRRKAQFLLWMVKCTTRDFTSTLVAWRMRCSFECVEWNGKSFFFKFPLPFVLATENSVWTCGSLVCLSMMKELCNVLKAFRTWVANKSEGDIMKENFTLAEFYLEIRRQHVFAWERWCLKCSHVFQSLKHVV